MYGQFKVTKPNKVLLTLTLTADLEYWRQVKKALTNAQGVDGSFYAHQHFLTLINDLIKLGESTFYVNTGETDLDGDKP